ncbi:MAG: tyrosine--tRNA ligase [Firmicutes bacterium]|uniref:Tyrosine--tRNA ligase n=1 Tax=Candidatus Onthovivens merdipullorum TaxID=2840889 RepID=A0A9D9DIR3_9BACL|nr:tyrosine--tRNA ligase [Candidatus Onthovivens merdipullorum]
MFDIISDLEYRGLIDNFSNKEKIKELLKTPQTIYCGFDPSASSMHIGNFVMISLLMRLQRAGHKIIAVVGGGTGMIGDPSGKSKERSFLTMEKVKENVESLKKQLSRFLDFSDPNKGIYLNNYEWLGKMSLIEYLRDVAKHFSINYMLSKDIVSSRLESGISLTEFTYMTLQSYDFYKLYKEYGCKIQVGGGDQWGNLTTGLDYIRKVNGPDSDCECMTCKLITRSDGKKFGKSEEGAIYLDKNLVSPYKMYQFFINQSDEDAIRYLKVFTFLSKDEIEEIAKEHFAHLGERIGQKRLAYEVTKIIHGEEEALRAIKMSEALFKNSFNELKENEITELFNNMKVKINKEMTLEDILISVKASTSKREAREFIKNGAISVNGIKVTLNTKIFNDEEYLYNKYLIIKRGKKNYYLAEL